MSFKYIMPPKTKGKKPKKPRKEPTQKQKQTVIVNISTTKAPPRRKGAPAKRERISQSFQPFTGQSMISNLAPTAQQVAYELKKLNDIEPKKINESKTKNIFDEYLAKERMKAVGLDSDTLPLKEQDELLNPKTFMPIDEEPMDDFDRMTIPMLKARLREIGVSTSGNKKQLINRLRQNEL
jgi:hypothetical protein